MTAGPDLRLEADASRSRQGRRAALAVAVVLAMLSIGLPVRLPQSSTSASIGNCLTIADAAPAGRGIGAALERCTALLPNDPELMADLGSEYEAAGQPELAEKIYQRAVSLDSDYADLRLRLARLMLRRGAADEARQQAESALRIQPNRKALLDVLQEATGRRGQP